jgi:hypothetical protein
MATLWQAPHCWETWVNKVYRLSIWELAGNLEQRKWGIGKGGM